MQTLSDWARQIDAVLNAGLRGTSLAGALHGDALARLAYGASFTDDFGHRRSVDPPLLAWVLGIPPWRRVESPRMDVRLWQLLHEADPLAIELAGDGPISPGAREEGIEVWTEIELASLQALWWHARRSGRTRVLARARSLARWLMDELQPDNGTNRPWALAAFAELGASGDEDASLYAGTLLHNCQVNLGKPDLFSTVLLVDAQRSLRERISGAPRR